MFKMIAINNVVTCDNNSCGLCIFEGGPGVHHSVGQLLDKLASQLNRSGLLETLYLVHRLDKETTGVMLLAKYVIFFCQMFSVFQLIECLLCPWDGCKVL